MFYICTQCVFTLWGIVSNHNLRVFSHYGCVLIDCERLLYRRLLFKSTPCFYITVADCKKGVVYWESGMYFCNSALYQTWLKEGKKQFRCSPSYNLQLPCALSSTGIPTQGFTFAQTPIFSDVVFDRTIPICLSRQKMPMMMILLPGDSHWYTGMLKGFRVLFRHFLYVDGWVSDPDPCAQFAKLGALWKI